MRIVILVLMAIIGFSFGFLGGMDLTGGNIELALALGSAGGVLGLHLTDLLYRMIAPPRRRRPTSPRPAKPRSHPPREFKTRLAQYASDVQTPVSHVTADRPSRMPFWSAVDSFVRVPPKSAALIRRTLLKIRALLGRSVSQ